MACALATRCAVNAFMEDPKRQRITPCWFHAETTKCESRVEPGFPVVSPKKGSAGRIKAPQWQSSAARARRLTKPVSRYGRSQPEGRSIKALRDRTVSARRAPFQRPRSTRLSLFGRPKCPRALSPHLEAAACKTRVWGCAPGFSASKAFLREDFVTVCLGAANET